MDYQRQLLAQLMHPLIPDSGKKFTDSDVCKDYLVELCPNELFTNTKVDLGQCKLFHDERLRNEYQNSPDKDSYGYERLFFERLQRLVQDIDRGIQKAKERLAARVFDEIGRDELQERRILIEKIVNELVQKVQESGEAGRVDEALLQAEEKERMQLELDTIINDPTGMSFMTGEKRMEVCKICGAYLVHNDAQERLEAHLEGKQHTGYQKLRDLFQEYERKLVPSDEWDKKQRNYPKRRRN